MNKDFIFLNNFLPYEEGRRYTQPPFSLVKLLPLGVVHSTKGDFLVDNESFRSILDAFHQRQLEIPIDYEHQTLKDMQAPAAGWIKDFVLRNDGIYGAVDWTKRAAEYLKNKEYRYLSPVIHIRKEDRKVMELHSAALTNTPAINAMTAIVNSNKPELNPPLEEPEDKTLEALARLLQLEPGAAIADIYQAVSTLLENQEALELKVNASQFEAAKGKADSVVKEALKEGRIMSWQKDMAFQSMLNDPDGFTTWLKTAPQVVPMGEFDFSSPLSSSRPRSKVYELLGLSAEDIEKYGNI